MLAVQHRAGFRAVSRWSGSATPSPSWRRTSLQATTTSLTVTGGTYANAAIGIDVDGATATVSGATISGNGTGVYIANGRRHLHRQLHPEQHVVRHEQHHRRGQRRGQLPGQRQRPADASNTFNVGLQGNPVSNDVTFVTRESGRHTALAMRRLDRHADGEGLLLIEAGVNYATGGNVTAAAGTLSPSRSSSPRR